MIPRRLVFAFRRPAVKPEPPGLTFCAHAYHCRECWDHTTKLVRSWIDKVAALERALQSIAKNTCCDCCQEAALVAQAAIRQVVSLADRDPEQPGG